MSLKMDFSGFTQLEKEFERLASDELKEIEKNALIAGAKIIKNQQEIEWNRSKVDSEHIEDNIIIGKAYETSEGSKITIAPKMSLRWRAKFVDYGTSHQAPQANTEKSVQIAGDKAAQAMLSEMEKILK